jgi:uncharacterized protein YdiU (UPF0061 family)
MHCWTYLSGLTSIRIPTDNSSYKTIINPKEIEERLLNRNLNHYAQAEHTAMANHLIRKKMGLSGTSEFCDQVLEGSADLTNFPITLQAIFQQLHQPHSFAVDDTISYEDYKDALHKWKETTSTSLSGRHLGHYISLLKQIGDKTDEMSDRIPCTHHKMLQLAQYRCKPFNWWKRKQKLC